jgi:hypothetical protein
MGAETREAPRTMSKRFEWVGTDCQIEVVFPGDAEIYGGPDDEDWNNYTLLIGDPWASALAITAPSLKDLAEFSKRIAAWIDAAQKGTR